MDDMVILPFQAPLRACVANLLAVLREADEAAPAAAWPPAPTLAEDLWFVTQNVIRILVKRRSSTYRNFHGVY